MKTTIQSFKYAGEGIKKAFLYERSFRIQLIWAVLAIVLGICFGITLLEWAIVLLCCAGVLSLELVNTAIETVVDMITDDHEPLAEKVKDIAAGAVLFFSLVSLVIGLIIFVPYFMRFVQNIWR